MSSLPPVTYSKLPNSMLPLGREAKKSIKITDAVEIHRSRRRSGCEFKSGMSGNCRRPFAAMVQREYEKSSR